MIENKFLAILLCALLAAAFAGCGILNSGGESVSYDPALEKGEFLNNASVAAGPDFAVALDGSGLLLGAGSNSNGQLDFSGWRSITALAAGSDFTIAAVRGETVASTSEDVDTSSWHDVIALDALTTHALGLSADGSVQAAGSDDLGQCETESWSDIVNIAAGDGFSAGLASDSTIVTAGKLPAGLDVSQWQGVLTISAGAQHLVGLSDTGVVHAAGSNEYGQCNTDDWTDIVLVCAGPFHTAGLRSDGSVVATGLNDQGQCDTSGFSDIVRLFAGDGTTLGLRGDGTLVGCGRTEYGGTDILSWDLSTSIPTDAESATPRAS